MAYSVIVLSILSLVALCAEGAVKEDLITALPGLTFKPNFKSYSGYLKATGSRKLHYWFTESSGNPATAPLVLWLNGGPGCSSMDGLLSEHGPFRVSEDGKKINENPYAWNTVANMLYMEAPAGVGYSYSDDKNYTTSDDQVALDNHEALKYFLKIYPEYAQNDFYLTGESYGGVYIPTLAARIMKDASFNFKGFAVGNGLMSYKMNSNSLLYFYYYHGIIGSALWKNMLNTCCKDSGDVDRCDFVGKTSTECQTLVSFAMASGSKLNMYNLYAECYQPKETSANRTALKWLFDPRVTLLSAPESAINTHRIKLASTAQQDQGEVPPCIDATGATVYMNRPDVRKALHIPPSLPEWAICSTVVGSHYERQYMTVVDVYKQLLAAQKYRILIYNGDVDMACNFLGDQWFLDSLGLKLIKPMTAWSYKAEDGSMQIAGFSKVYDQKVLFTTIRGAGHMVPQDKPIPALDMFKGLLGIKEF